MKTFGKVTGRRKIRKEHKTLVCPEPIRKSMLDTICDNLKIAGRATFIHRLIYIGEHSFSDVDNIAIHMRENIVHTNSSYCEEYLTGFLLYYPKYFCHVLEGSEETLYRHLDLLFSNEDTASNIVRTKILTIYHHVNQRFIHQWTEITAKPPTLLEKIDPDSDLEATCAKVYHCIGKLYKLGISLRPPEPVDDIDTEIEMTEYLEDKNISRRSLGKVISTVSNFDTIGRPVDNLPEFKLLDFLLESRYTENLKTYASSFGRIPSLWTYLDKIWPVVCDFVPRNIFDKEFDPITDLPEREIQHDTL